MIDGLAAGIEHSINDMMAAYGTGQLLIMLKVLSGDGAPGWAEGQVSTVKMLGSGWSNATALTGLNLARSYLRRSVQQSVVCRRTSAGLHQRFAEQAVVHKQHHHSM